MAHSQSCPSPTRIYLRYNQTLFKPTLGFPHRTSPSPKPKRTNLPSAPAVIEMTTVPGPLIWEIVKKNNSFLVKQFGNGTASIRFSKEPNNLFNLNSYKHSGLANKKTVTIQGLAKDNAVLLGTTKIKKQNKPKLLLKKSVLKKEFSRMAKAVVNQVGDNHYRPDLKNAALARLSVVHRSLKIAKSGPKKRNRQATKIPSRK